MYGGRYMKKLDVSWDRGVYDRTGYLFSFAKSLGLAVKCSPYAEFAEDIIATSGFAFRMWAAEDLCPSATSIWDFDGQKPWVENGGLQCGYVGRYWNMDQVEEEKRLAALEIIKESIDRGIPAVAWDLGVPEWGAVIGYDDDWQKLTVLSVTGREEEVSYDQLGKGEIPILSVLTVKGRSTKSPEHILKDTLRLAAFHLNGMEWCSNASGLSAYPVIVKNLRESFNPERSWNIEYYLGTYGGLKYFAHRYFAKMNLMELARLYENVYLLWQQAFDLKQKEDLNNVKVRSKIAELLEDAYENERKALEVISGLTS